MGLVHYFVIGHCVVPQLLVLVLCFFELGLPEFVEDGAYFTLQNLLELNSHVTVGS